MKLKGVILSLENVVFHDNRLIDSAFDEIGRFVRLLLEKGIQPVILANRTWMVGNRPLQDFINEQWAEFPWFVASEGTGAWKPRAEAVETVLDRMDWQATEVAYVGNTTSDMRTAKNGGVLFLNVEWFTHSVDYGLQFSTVKDLARFIDVFCIRDHLWHFVIDAPPLRVYSLSPYSTYKEEYARYSENARSALKFGGEYVDFWTKYLCSSIYFSGLHQEINYVTPYPGHRRGAGNPLIDDFLVQVATCFGVPYLRDLIVRHTDAPKSQTDRTGASHYRQLNTIHVNRSPLKSLGNTRYKNSPLRGGRTVLVVDDFCTAGYSLEAARNYIEQTGASVICATFLKTINTDYRQLTRLKRFNPYTPNRFKDDDGRIAVHTYRSHIVDRAAPGELTEALRRYDEWDWPH